MRRMMLVVTVALVMGAMMVAMAAPAFAKKQTYTCFTHDGGTYQNISKNDAKDLMKRYPTTTSCYPEG